MVAGELDRKIQARIRFIEMNVLDVSDSQRQRSETYARKIITVRRELLTANELKHRDRNPTRDEMTIGRWLLAEAHIGAMHHGKTAAKLLEQNARNKQPEDKNNPPQRAAKRSNAEAWRNVVLPEVVPAITFTK